MLDNYAREVPRTSASWWKVRRAMRKLFDELADLDESGGVAAVADEELWTEAEVARAVGDMILIRRMMRGEVARLRGKAVRNGDFAPE